MSLSLSFFLSLLFYPLELLCDLMWDNFHFLCDFWSFVVWSLQFVLENLTVYEKIRSSFVLVDESLPNVYYSIL